MPPCEQTAPATESRRRRQRRLTGPELYQEKREVERQGACTRRSYSCSNVRSPSNKLNPPLPSRYTANGRSRIGVSSSAQHCLGKPNWRALTKKRDGCSFSVTSGCVCQSRVRRSRSPGYVASLTHALSAVAARNWRSSATSLPTSVRLVADLCTGWAGPFMFRHAMTLTSGRRCRSFTLTGSGSPPAASGDFHPFLHAFKMSTLF